MSFHSLTLKLGVTIKRKRKPLAVSFSVLFLLLILLAMQLWGSSHYRGAGAATPAAALSGFVDAIETRNYLRLRELQEYSTSYCGGMDVTAVAFSDPEAVHSFEKDHLALSAKSIRDRLFFLFQSKGYLTDSDIERASGYRWYILHYTPFLAALELKPGLDTQRVIVKYPLLAYNTDGIGPSLGTEKNHVLILVLGRINNRWYVQNFTCQMMGIYTPEPAKWINHTVAPQIGPFLIEEMKKKTEIIYEL